MVTEKTQVYPIWVDWANRVISFREAQGFEKLVYPTRKLMLAFAVEKCMAGFGIQ